MPYSDYIQNLAKKIEEMVLGTMILRIFIIIYLFIIGYSGNFPFLFFMILVVGLGITGTLWSLRDCNLKIYLILVSHLKELY